MRRLLVLVVVLGQFTMGCGDDDAPGGAADGVYTDVGDVFARPDALIGESVSGVTGEVGELVGADAFLLRSADGGDQILVVARAMPPMGEGAVVEVAGEVVVLRPDSFQADFGLTYDEPYGTFAGDTVIRATSVDVVRPSGS